MERRKVRNGVTTFRKLFPPTSLTFLTFPTFLSACHSSPEKEQEKLRQQLSSWEATEHLASELSERGALPGVYVRQIAEVVQQGKQKVRQQAAKSSR